MNEKWHVFIPRNFIFMSRLQKESVYVNYWNFSFTALVNGKDEQSSVNGI